MHAQNPERFCYSEDEIRTGAPMNNGDGATIAHTLERYLQGELEDSEVKLTIQQAMQSGDTKYIPVLRRIAEMETNEKRDVIFHAYYALQQLGQPDAYFRDFIVDHAANEWQAYYAILLLGRQPDTALLDLLESIKSQTDSVYVRGATDIVFHVAGLKRQYERLDTPQARSDFLMEHFRTDWNPIIPPQPTDADPVDPQEAWTQQKLFELSEEAPDIAARFVHDLDYAETDTRPQFTRMYRQFLAGFLADEARARFEALA